MRTPVDGSVVAQKVKEKLDDATFGYNALTHEYGDLLKMGVIVPTKVERVALTSFENLHFFEDTRRLFGRVKFQGVEEHRGERAYRLRFMYPSGMYFDRFFSTEDGDLIATIDDRGIEIVEEGEFVVNGLVFPKRILTFEEDKLLHTVVFENIEVNPELDDSLFEIPSKIR